MTLPSQRNLPQSMPPSLLPDPRGRAALEPIPHVLHQIWLGEDLSSQCWCSSASWRAFAIAHGWRYRLWRDADLRTLNANATGRALLMTRDEHRTSVGPAWLRSALARTSISKYEILHQHGGFYVDCDLLWLGAAPASDKTPSTVSRSAGASLHWPTEQLVALLNERRLPPLIASPHSMANRESLSAAPLTTSGPGHVGMSQLYLNTALLAAPRHDSLIRRLLQLLPRLIDASDGTPAEEWRVTGPEAFNRAVSAADRPITLLPSRWVYPYSNEAAVVPPMTDVRAAALTWGELKPMLARTLWSGFVGDTRVNTRAEPPSADRQCV